MINGTILQCFYAYMPDAGLSGSVAASGVPDRSLWQQIAQDASSLAQAGFSALWLPPMTKASGGATDIGYSVYDLYDLGEFDQCGSVATRYGDRAQLLAAIAAAQSAQLQVYGDVVLHRKHGGDGIEVLSATPVSWRDRNRAMAPVQPIKVHSQFTFPGRGQRYSPMTWRGEHFQLANHNCLTPTPDANKRWLYALKPKPFSIDIDVRLNAQGLLARNIPCCESSTCCADADAVVSRTADNSALICELDLEMPEVAQALDEWGQWLLATTGLNGLRLDGAKHMSASFVRDWVTHLRTDNLQNLGDSQSGDSQFHSQSGDSQSGRPPLFFMGDCWSDQVNDLHWYIAKTDGQLSLFDVPLHYNFHRASRQESYYDLRNILKGTLMDEQPTLAVTFVDNHNSQPGQLLESPVEEWFKPLAYALILLRQEGYPCVFGADYWGTSNPDILPNGEVRQAKIPSHRRLLDQMLFVRSHHVYGAQYDYFEQCNIIGWTQLGNHQHPQAMAVVMSNGHSGQQWMSVGKPNTRFIDVTGHLREPVWTNQDGWAAFGCSQRSVSVWVEQT